MNSVRRLSFTCLSDEGNKLRKQFGVPTNLMVLLPGRVTYLADKTGKVTYIGKDSNLDHILSG